MGRDKRLLQGQVDREEAVRQFCSPVSKGKGHCWAAIGYGRSRGPSSGALNRAERGSELGFGLWGRRKVPKLLSPTLSSELPCPLPLPLQALSSAFGLRQSTQGRKWGRAPLNFLPGRCNPGFPN